MRQSRLMSLVEALANVAVGCCVAVLTQTPVYPRFELDTILRQNPTIGLIFKVVSIVRSYALRRTLASLPWVLWSGFRIAGDRCGPRAPRRLLARESYGGRTVRSVLNCARYAENRPAARR